MPLFEPGIEFSNPTGFRTHIPDHRNSRMYRIVEVRKLP
jgi:hypothetical protein